VAEPLPPPEPSDDLLLEQDTAPRGWSRFAASSAAPRAVAEASASGRRLLFAGALAIVVATGLTLGFRDDSQLTFELRGATAHAGVIEARRGEATVALSDGSSILAENGTRFRVEVLGSGAALTRLESGKLHVSVTHDEGTSYRFVAGPYELRVAGAELDLAWGEPTGLGVSVTKGEVHLRGAGDVQRVKAGQSVTFPPSSSGAAAE
jgi:ferric-dicitrate binding protein FerR (iron transport regulator)